jgi:asparagine synthase (glutamine-hydrolysing)
MQHIFCGIVGEPSEESRRRLRLGLAPDANETELDVATPNGRFLATPGAASISASPAGPIALVRARFDEPAELTSRLELSSHRSDAELVLAAYLRWGASFASQLRGDFALAVWDPGEQQLVCAVDALGIGQLFVTRAPSGASAFSSHLGPLRSLWGPALALDRRALAAHLCDLPDDPSATSFANIRRVPPGSFFVARDRQSFTRRYFDLSSLPKVHFRRDEEWIDGFRERLDRAVQRRTSGANSVSISLSAGLDSSFVFALAAQRGGAPPLLPMHVAVRDPAECDETADVRALGVACGVLPTHLEPEAAMSAMDVLEQAVGEPRLLDPQSIVVSALRGASNAGARRMLTGLYGDVVGGAVGNHYASLLKEEGVPRWWRELSGLEPEQWLRSAVGSVLNAWGPTRDTLAAANLWRRRKTDWRGCCVRGDALEELGLIERKRESARQDERAKYDVLAGRPLWLDRCAPAETEVMGRLGMHFGLELAHPFADLDLVALSLSLPVGLLKRQRLTRYVEREAMRGLVPDRIRLRRRKVVFDTFFEGSFAELVPAWRSSPLHSELESLLDWRRVHEMAADSSRWTGRAGFHVWRCLAANVWLHRHRTR